MGYFTLLFECLQSGIWVNAINTDFRKSFDKVDQRMFLWQLAFNGKRSDLLWSFQSYIINLTHKVVIKGFSSNLVIATSGVLHDSILGPLLFVIFNNYIPHCFQQCIFCYILIILKYKKYIQSKTASNSRKILTVYNHTE